MKQPQYPYQQAPQYSHQQPPQYSHQQPSQYSYQQAPTQLTHLGHLNHGLQAQNNPTTVRKEQIDRVIESQRKAYENEVNGLRVERQNMVQNEQRLSAAKQLAKEREEKIRLLLEQSEKQREQLILQNHALKERLAHQSTSKTHLSTELLEAKHKAELLDATSRKHNLELKDKEATIIQLQTEAKELLTSLMNSQQDLRLLQDSDVYAQNKRLGLENVKLKNLEQRSWIEGVSNEVQAYELLKTTHQQLAIYRYDLAQNKTDLHEKEMQINNLKAILQLKTTDYSSHQEQFKTERLKSRQEMESLNKRLATLQIQQDQIQQLVEQIFYLKIKVFVLESIKVGQRYKGRDWEQGCKDELTMLSNNDYTLPNKGRLLNIYRAKGQRQVQQFCAQLQQIMRTLSQRLRLEQANHKQSLQKGKQFKQKAHYCEKKVFQLSKEVEQWQVKQREYQKLIQKLYKQLQKVYLSQNDADKNIVHSLLVPYQHEVEMLKQEINRLQSQNLEHQSRIQIEKQNHTMESNRLIAQIALLSSAKAQLQAQIINHQQQSLETTLSSITQRFNYNYQHELAQKTSLILSLEVEIKQLKAKPPSGEKKASSEQMIGWGWKEPHEESLVLRQGLEELKIKYEQKDSQLSSCIKQIQTYRERLAQLQTALQKASQESYRKSQQILKLTEQNTQYTIRIEKLQEKAQIYKVNSKSMRQIQLIQKSETLQTRLFKMEIENEELVQKLKNKANQMEQMQQQCSDYRSINIKLMDLLQENNIGITESRLLASRHQRQLSHEQQLQAKIESLAAEVASLTRAGQLKKGQVWVQEHERLKEMQYLQIIENKQQRIRQYQREIVEMQENNQKDKLYYNQQWNKLFAELQALRRQLQDHQRLFSINNRNQTINHNTQQFNQQIGRMSRESQELQEKVEQINRMRRENIELKEKVDQEKQLIVQIQRRYSSSMKEDQGHMIQLRQLRQSVHNLREGRLRLEDRIRNLQQENLLLKIHRISEEHAQYGQDQNANATEGALNSDASHHKDYQHQLLSLLVLSWLEIESLRTRVVSIQNQAEANTIRYIDRLRQIQFKELDGFEDAKVELIEKLECSHKHLMQIKQREPKPWLESEYVSFRNLQISNDKAKMIESYQVGVGERIFGSL